METYGKAVATIQEGSTGDSKFGPNGGFTAILSDASEDRDYEELTKSQWMELPPKCSLDMDHGMKVVDTIGSYVPYWDGDTLMMDANFASTKQAQDVRTLVNEGHIFNVSVAFLRHKNQKSNNEPWLEMLNAGVCGVPSNRNAVILASKAANVLKDALSTAAEDETLEEVKSAVLEALGPGAETDQPDTKEHTPDEVETKADKKPYGNVRYADPEDGKYPIDTVAHIRAALAYINVQKNYDALGDHAAHVKAAIEAAAKSHGIDVAHPHGGKSFTEEDRKPAGIYVDVIPRLDEAALKAVYTELLTKASAQASGIGAQGALVQAIHDASSHLGAACPVVQEPDVDPDSGASDGSNKSLETFEKDLDAVLKSPAEAAAASEEDPAPANDAADTKANKRGRLTGINSMLIGSKSNS